MKKIILLLAVVTATLFTSCTSDDGAVQVPQNGSYPQLNTPDIVQMKYVSSDPLEHGPVVPHRHLYSFMYILDIDNLSPELNPIENVKIDIVHSSGTYAAYDGPAQRCNIFKVPSPFSLRDIKYKITLKYQDGSIESIQHSQDSFYSSYAEFICE